MLSRKITSKQEHSNLSIKDADATKNMALVVWSLFWKAQSGTVL
jgi:hypothetical protein